MCQPAHLALPSTRLVLRLIAYAPWTYAHLVLFAGGSPEKISELDLERVFDVLDEEFNRRLALGVGMQESARKRSSTSPNGEPAIENGRDDERAVRRITPDFGGAVADVGAPFRTTPGAVPYEHVEDRERGSGQEGFVRFLDEEDLVQRGIVFPTVLPDGKSE